MRKAPAPGGPTKAQITARLRKAMQEKNTQELEKAMEIYEQTSGKGNSNAVDKDMMKKAKELVNKHKESRRMLFY